MFPNNNLPVESTDLEKKNPPFTFSLACSRRCFFFSFNQRFMTITGGSSSVVTTPGPFTQSVRYICEVQRSVTFSSKGANKGLNVLFS